MTKNYLRYIASILIILVASLAGIWVFVWTVEDPERSVLPGMLATLAIMGACNSTVTSIWENTND